MYSGVPQKAIVGISTSVRRHTDLETLTVRLVLLRHVEFTETEVAQGDVSGVVQKNVFGFEVAGRVESGTGTAPEPGGMGVPVHHVEHV